MGRKEITDICHRLYDKEFVAATDGNVSERIAENRFLITRSALCKGEVTEDSILEIDSDGNVLDGDGKPSTEYKLHLHIYKNRKDINSVIHCHPVYTSAFAVAGKNLNHLVLPEVILTLGKISLCEYGSPSTDELARSLDKDLDTAAAFILKNHGAVTIGSNLKQAYYRMEKLEHTAKIEVMAKILGGAQEINKEKISELLSYSEKVYGVKMKENLL